MKKPLLLELETLRLFFFSVAVLKGQYISFPCPPSNPSLSFKGLFLVSISLISPVEFVSPSHMPSKCFIQTSISTLYCNCFYLCPPLIRP